MQITKVEIKLEKGNRVQVWTHGIGDDSQYYHGLAAGLTLEELPAAYKEMVAGMEALEADTATTGQARAFAVKRFTTLPIKSQGGE